MMLLLPKGPDFMVRCDRDLFADITALSLELFVQFDVFIFLDHNSQHIGVKSLFDGF